MEETSPREPGYTTVILIDGLETRWKYNITTNYMLLSSFMQDLVLSRHVCIVFSLK
jgi:hypothetical protein